MNFEELIQDFRNKGNACFKNKNFLDAIKYYEEGLALDPDNPHLHNNIAQALLEIHDFESAEYHATIAVQLQGSAKAYYRAARACHGRGDRIQAMKYLKDGIEKCDNTFTEDLRQYLWMLVKDDFPCTETVVPESQEDVSGTEEVPPLTSDSEPDEYIHNDKLRSQSVSRVSASRTSLDNNKEFQSLLKEGSELMGRGLSRRAVEKYKTALDMILEHSAESFGVKEIDLVVLKYAVCVGWIDLANYGDIVEALEHLKDIEDTRASKFPAVFYGLGSAYYKLNRYKIATEHLEKGLLFLKREVNFEVHSWPGTNDIIPETTRNGLQEVLKELHKTCRAYHEPDAICRYSKCLNISSHIIPSEHIFYSDPDFCGFVVVFCQEKCRIEYHLGCWKNYKEAVMCDEIGKLSEKDFIGRSCPTTDCVTQTNERSVITKIEIVGEDTTVKASIEAPKSDTAIKESKKIKKKKCDKNAEATVQDKPKNKLHPKTKKSISETIQTTSQEMQAPSAAELELRLDKLKVLRDVNFGYTNDTHWNPQENYYGREDVRQLDHFLSPEFNEETDGIRGKKEYVFTYFYEFIRSEGPQKITELEQKWQNEESDFEGVSDFINSHTSISSFLRQSYRFATVDDYICLAEQLAETYKMAKAGLVESLSFTLMGVANYTKLLPDMSEHPVINSPHIEPEMKRHVTANLNVQDYDCKPSVVTTLGSFVDQTQGSTKCGEVFIPHPEVHDLVEDPDIHTVEDILAAKRLLTVSTESVSEGEGLVLGDSSLDDSDDSDDHGVGDDGVEQEKNQMTHKETTVENQDINDKEGTEKKQIEEELWRGLNPDASEFKPIEVTVQKQGVPHTGGNFEVKTAAQTVPAPVTNVHLASEYNALDVPPALQSACSKLEQLSLEDGQPKVSAAPLNLSLQTTAVSLAVSHAHPVIHVPPFASPMLPSQQLSKLSDISTQTNEMPHIEEEVVILKSKVKELVQQLEDGNNQKETLKKTLESKLEQQDKKIKELELEMAKVEEKNAKDTETLKEKLKEKEEECEAEKAKLNEEKQEKEISESKTKEMLRDLISETGQKVKELEEELALRKREIAEYQLLLLEAKIEARELQIRVVKQKCMDRLSIMQLTMKYVSDSDIQKKSEITGGLQNWEQYFASITQHQVQFRVYCSVLKEKLGTATLADFTQKWPDLPEEPTCPLYGLEEITQKALDEDEYMKGKLVIRDKAVTEMKEQQHNAVTAVEEQHLKLKKVIENRQEKIKQLAVNKEQALEPSKTLEKLNEVAKKVDPTNLQEEEKVGKKPEQLVGSDNQGLKQNICSNFYTSSSPANATSPANPLAGVPYFQPSTHHYGHQPLMHSSPYFFPQVSYTPVAVPVVYGQQQNPPVTSFSSAFQCDVPSATKGSDKGSAQQQAELKPAPSSFVPEFSTFSVSSTGMADKSQPPVESKTVPKKKKSPSPVSGLTPIEFTRNVSTQGVTAVATSQEIDEPLITKALPVSTSTVEVPKQNLSQMSKPAETQKPLLQPPCSIPGASTAESRPNITSTSKQKKNNSFQKLMDQLRASFPTKTEEELAASVAAVRERNNNSLTGLTLPVIMSRVDKFLKEKANKKQGSMGLDKFGGFAWGGMRDSATSWSKSNDNSQEECIICMEPMDEDQTSLHCHHSFHTKCIRKWLRTESVCPICRVFTRMVDEYPPLS